MLQRGMALDDLGDRIIFADNTLTSTLVINPNIDTDSLSSEL